MRLKFIRKHTQGPWSIACNSHLIAKNNEIAIFHKDDDWENEQAANKRLISAAPEMMGYLIKRFDDLYAVKDWISSTRFEEDEERKHLLELIKKAGVEVA